MTLSRRTLILTALASTPLFAAAAAAFPAQPLGDPAAPDLTERAHHKPWHSGGRGRHLGWYKQKRGKRKGWGKHGW